MNLNPGARAIVSVLIIAATLSSAAFFYVGTQQRANTPTVPTHFAVNGKTFEITYVATTESEWTEGLNDKKVTDTTTMLFIFPQPGVQVFWMDRVNSSLDMIWINVTGGVGRVVYLVPSAPVCPSLGLCPDYVPSSAANYVLEAKGGFSSANDISVGTTIQFG